MTAAGEKARPAAAPDASGGGRGAFAVRGAIEGFYGTPFSWEERERLVRFIAARGMNAYVYAPKNDPLHRERWRDPYDAGELAAFASLARTAGECGVRLVYAIAPGLTYDASDAREFERLDAKLRQLIDAGAGGIALLFDDIAADSSAVDPELQAELVARTRARVAEIAPAAAFWFIGNYYAGTAPELDAGGGIFAAIYGRPPRAYFDAYAARVPADVPILWTGPAVFSARITRDDALGFRDLVRRPVIAWDNYPVNDALPWNLFLGPYVGRDAALADALDGIVVNLMGQPAASRIALATIARYLAAPSAYDPERAFADAVREIAPTAHEAFARFADHHRGHPVLAAGEGAGELARLADAALGRAPADPERLAELARHLDELSDCASRLALSLDDADLWREVEPWSAKLGDLARAARAGLDALAGVRSPEEFRALRAAAEARPHRVACTRLPDALRPFAVGGGEGVDRFADLFAAIERALG
ncbi:MAG TPA: beta-N-acetylglucosaminidase domain-containing protein [Candidatus Binatia bacterium]|nr:beta-N-acetylglucosaminidase domain-containing protein [Candidatus Binatia bacterium]